MPIKILPTKILTIKKTADFKTNQNNCKKYHAQTLILLESKTPNKYLSPEISNKKLIDFCRFGITISKQVHKSSCARNFIRRRLKNAIDTIIQDHGKIHHDYVIIAKKQILAVDYKKIYSDLKFCFKRI